jgi:DNA repair exonuclease SbcCD ATPase subunit
MKFNINKVTIQNFLSIGNIELEFSNQGSVLIQGKVVNSSSSDSNGSGKSSMIDAINWVLFDETLRGISKDDVVNEKFGKDCFVTLSGSINDHKIEITRYRKHKEFKNQIRLVYNEQEISESTDSKTNNKIEEILGMSFKDFQSNIVFSNNSMKFLELGDTDRKKIFDSIVKSDLYENCIDLTKSKIKEKEEELVSFNFEKTRLNDKFEFQDKQLRDYLKHSEEFDKNRFYYINKYSQEKVILEQEILKEQEKKCEIVESKEFLEENNSLLYKQIEQVDNEMKLINQNSEEIEIRKQIDSYQESVEVKTLELLIKEKNEVLTRKRIDSNKLQDSISNNKQLLNASIKQLKDQEDKFTNYEINIKDNLCPLCNQKVTDIHNIQEELDKINCKIVEIKNIITMYENSIKEGEQSLSIIVKEGKQIVEDIDSNQKLLITKKEQILEHVTELKEKEQKIRQELNLKFAEFVSQKQNINKQIDMNRVKIETIRSFYINKEISINKIKSKIEECDNNILKYQKEENLFLVKIKEIEEEKVKVINLFNEVDSKIQKINIEGYKYWINGFKKIKGLLISTITPIMNEKAIEYSNILTNGEFNIKFITQRENKDGSLKDVFDIEVSRKDGGVKYHALSSGEKRRVDLIVIFVLDELKRVNCGEMNVRFYDEVLDSLDEVGVEKTINLLSSIAENKQIFIISHRSDLKDLFSKCITVVKKDGITSILGGQNG